MEFITDFFSTSDSGTNDLGLNVLFWGMLAIFLLFRVGRFALSRFVQGVKLRSLLLKVLPIIETFAWIILAVWAIFNYVIEGDSKKETGNVLFLILLIVLILLISWFVLRDFIAGIILRLEGAFDVHDFVRSAGVEGEVKKLGFRSIKLETNQGELVTIPYRGLMGEISSKSKREGSGVSVKLRLGISGVQDWDTVFSILEKTLLNSPWSMLNRQPRIELAEEGETFLVECTVYVLDHKHLLKLKNYLRKQPQSNVMQIQVL